MILWLLACSGSVDPEAKYGEHALLASTAADFLLQSRNGRDAQTFHTYNAAAPSDGLGLWDSSYSSSSLNPNAFRIVVSVGSDGLIDVVRPYGTTGAVTIPSGGYLLQATSSFLPWLNGLAVDDELRIRSTSECTGIGVPVAMYHSIGSSGSALEAHLQAIDQAGYTTITLDELRGFLNGPDDCDPALPQNPILLTFDDGYADQFASAPALLQKYGMVGTFFIITSYPGTTSTWATWTAISDAVTNYPDAVELACHSHAGHYQTTIDGKLVSAYLQDGFDVAADMATCRETLQKYTGVLPTALAWPFGTHTDALIDTARKAGFELMFNTWPGLNTPDNDDPEGEGRRFGFNVSTSWTTYEAQLDRWTVCP